MPALVRSPKSPSTPPATSSVAGDDTDIPTLDADKIVSGQFNKRIADDAITARISPTTPPASCNMKTTLERATSSGSSGTPHPLHNSEFTPDGSGPENIWLPVGFVALQANNLRWGGTSDADTDTIVSVTAIGTGRNRHYCRQFPPPSNEMSGLYFITNVAVHVTA